MAVRRHLAPSDVGPALPGPNQAAWSKAQPLPCQTLTAALIPFIDALSLPSQQLLSLRYCDGLTPAEVGQVLSITEAQVRARERRLTSHLGSAMLASFERQDGLSHAGSPPGAPLPVGHGR